MAMASLIAWTAPRNATFVTAFQLPRMKESDGEPFSDSEDEADRVEELEGSGEEDDSSADPSLFVYVC